MISYDEMYEQFLGDMDENEDNPDIFQEPASFEQISLLNSLVDSNAMNAIPDREVALICSWINSNMSYRDASILIDRILKAQPNEAPIHSQKQLAKWIKKNKLSE